MGNSKEAVSQVMTQDFDALLQQLTDAGRPVRSIDLFALSDATRDRVTDFERAWKELEVDRRLELVNSMVEQAEANIHLNFHAVLRALLRDPDGRVRKLAIEGLWEDERTNLVLPLIALLRGDPMADVRATAAVSLGRYLLLGALGEIDAKPVREAEQALREAWFRSGEVNDVRRRALEGLACCELRGINEMIRSAYYDDDASMRQSALFAMGRTADSRWSKLVLAELNSYEPAMRFEAAQAAGEIGLKSAVARLVECIEDVDSAVREAAVIALGKIGGPNARRILKAVLRGDDEALAHAAEDALDELSFGSSSVDDALMVYEPGTALEAELTGERVERFDDEDEDDDAFGVDDFSLDDDDDFDDDGFGDDDDDDSIDWDLQDDGFGDGDDEDDDWDDEDDGDDDQ